MPNIGLHTARCYAANGILALLEKLWVGFHALQEPQRRVSRTSYHLVFARKYKTKMDILFQLNGTFMQDKEVATIEE